ncbi:Tat pathway signal sequence domain protein [Streptomyces sp. SS1-1]|uniref:Tat pathway signal sequence domain protein n=1 Tax=Streptomyces sp. SS1-1 TaxID=2651869 RepID=UPI00124FB3F5|nr:Tat pathway signal sequence domain protein [Streptomyces sp. SS1-1]KAB2973833.1 Tat pathway signal sequence domain protein [Streptomyces sp. SS1-1]
MRRTVFSALALTCTALLASAAPALADSSTPSPVPTRVAEDAASPVPSTGPADEAASPVPAERGQVAVRPSGAPDTGVADTSSGTATGGLVGGGAAAVLLAGGAATFVVRRRRTHGA